MTRIIFKQQTFWLVFLLCQTILVFAGAVYSTFINLGLFYVIIAWCLTAYSVYQVAQYITTKVIIEDGDLIFEKLNDSKRIALRDIVRIETGFRLTSHNQYELRFFTDETEVIVPINSYGLKDVTHLLTIILKNAPHAKLDRQAQKMSEGKRP